MKRSAAVFVALFVGLLSSQSHALVRLVADCQSANNLYRVVIMDNAGIGPVRTPNLRATIRNAQGDVLAAYAVNENELKSTSFGAPTYIDRATGGKQFRLWLGSTNSPRQTVSAALNDAVRLSSEVRCKIY